jgi:hypothetical protein
VQRTRKELNKGNRIIIIIIIIANRSRWREQMLSKRLQSCRSAVIETRMNAVSISNNNNNNISNNTASATH